MNYNPPVACSLYCVIVNNGLGSKVVRIAKENKVLGSTILIGRGTVKSSMLNFLGISDERKEVVLMAASKEVGDAAILEVYTKTRLNRPNRGIAFSISVDEIIGSKIACEKIKNKEENKMSYNLIMTIVDRGNAENVIDAATAAGSRGGTILTGRGSGVHETQKVFNIEIEPEKEIVLILAKNEVTKAITSSICNLLHIDEPGKGIIFVIGVDQTYGLYDQEK